MKLLTIPAALISTSILFGVSPAQAAVTYVDAGLSNTVGAASGLVDWNDGGPAPLSDGSANADGLWRFRGGFGGNGIWEASGTTATVEDAVELLTSAPVSNGTYNVFVFYYAVTANGEFPIRAGFTSNPNANPLFTSSTGMDSASLNFVAEPPRDATRTLLFGEVGQTTVTGGTLEVFVDDFPANFPGGTSSERTWYSGIGFEIVPEPSAAMLGLSGLALLLRRSRRNGAGTAANRH